MFSNVRIIRLRNAIRFNAQGILDLEETKKAIREIASVRGAFVDYDVLIDTRGAEVQLSITDDWEIAQDLAKEVHANAARGFTAKIAVICVVERFPFAEFLALSAQNRGLNMQAFTSFEELFEWLSEPSPPNHEPS